MSRSTTIMIKDSKVKLTSPCNSDVVRCEHENFEVHKLPEAFFKDGVDSLKDDDRCRLNEL